MIEIVNLTKQYGDHVVLNNISEVIADGEKVAIVGPSGGGKSTVCNLIPRFYNVGSGRITVDGIDVMDITLDSLRRNIGMVSQSVFLFDGTIRENIAYGNESATDEEIIEAAKLAGAHDFILSARRIRYVRRRTRGQAFGWSKAARFNSESLS